MTFLLLVGKGFLIGLAFIIPGVSGGTIAVYLGVYDKILHAIGRIHREFKESVKLLAPIFLGVALSVVALAKIIGWLLDWNSWITLCLFIGLIIGGIPGLFRKLERRPIRPGTMIPMLMAFVTLTGFIIHTSLNSEIGVSEFDMNAGSVFLILILGMAGAMTMVVPGISGSALLMALGFYTAIVTNVIGNVFDFSQIGYNLFVIAPFGVGILLGIFLSSRLLDFLLRVFPASTYGAIIGLVLASVIGIFLEIRDPLSAPLFSDQIPVFQDFFGYVSSQVLTSVIGVIVLGAGIVVSLKFVKLESKANGGAKTEIPEGD